MITVISSLHNYVQPMSEILHW